MTTILRSGLHRLVGGAPQLRTMSYFAGKKISSSDLAMTDEKVRQVSRQYISRCMQKCFWEDAMPSPIIPMENTSLSGQLIAWKSVTTFPPAIAQNGQIRLLNSDKLDTFVHAAAILNLPNPQAKKTLIIDEGCDNGDILGYAIPWLSRKGHPVGVVLTNGNEEKLTVASKLANWLLQKENSPGSGASSVLHNSFRDRVTIEDTNEPDLQKFFMLYHLGIVERPQVVSEMVARRIQVMDTNDVGLITMLRYDEESELRFKARPGYQVFDTGFDGSVTIRKRVSSKTAEVLDGLHADKDDFFNYLTAMTPDTACHIIRSAGGDVVYGSTINTITEEGIPTKVMGVVFKRRPLYNSR